jgi:hypothetical protein
MPASRGFVLAMLRPEFAHVNTHPIHRKGPSLMNDILIGSAFVAMIFIPAIAAFIQWGKPSDGGN